MLLSRRYSATSVRASRFLPIQVVRPTGSRTYSTKSRYFHSSPNDSDAAAAEHERSPSPVFPLQASMRLENAFRVDEALPSLSLKIANPATLLNHISHRYASTSRIIMEFIDNPLDDAETLFRSKSPNAYPYPVRVVISIDHSKKTLRVVDNCRGMGPEQLQRLVEKVGESQKKGVSWLNGRFGFGVHSFRAAAERLTVKTKRVDGPMLKMEITRDQVDGIRPPQEVPHSPDAVSDGIYNSVITTSGTEVTLSGFDEDWWRDISLENLTGEIEQHFERLLARPKLQILVQEVANGAIIRQSPCKPFDYSKIDGVRVSKILHIESAKGVSHEVPIELVVAQSDAVSHKARFFALGRRINEVSNVASFMKQSQLKKSLWSHPQLIGYVDVGNILEPVITRDEFRRTLARHNLFEALIAMEPEIKQALDSELDKQRVVSMGKLEGVLDNVLDKIFQDDRKEERRKEKMRRDLLKSAMAYEEPLLPSPPAPELQAPLDPSPAVPIEATPETSAAEMPKEETKTEEALEAAAVPVAEAPQTSFEPEVETSAVPETDPIKLDEGIEAPPAVEAPTQPEPVLAPSAVVEEKAPEEPKMEPIPEPIISKPNKAKKHRVGGIHVTFVAIPANDEGVAPRSHIVDDAIHINTLHPDFTSRIRSRLGRPVITERLGAYLGSVLAGHYHSQRYVRLNLDPTIPSAFEDLISLTNKIEYNIRRKLPALQRSMGSLLPQSVVDTLQVEGDDFDDLDSFSDEEL